MSSGSPRAWATACCWLRKKKPRNVHAARRKSAMGTSSRSRGREIRTFASSVRKNGKARQLPDAKIERRRNGETEERGAARERLRDREIERLRDRETEECDSGDSPEGSAAG